MFQNLKNHLHAVVARLAAIYYGFPGKYMTVIGVTGTAGKTTTTHLIYQILKSAKLKVSMLSTVSAEINGRSFDTGFHVTTPSPWALQKFLKMAKEGSSQYFILEVTSHALDQHRIFGIPITIGVVTNITHEHLDYHKTIENYRRTKMKLLDNVKYSVLNKDDQNYDYLAKRACGQIITYSFDQEADFRQSLLNLHPKLPGDYNLYNCLAAFAVASILKVNNEIIKKTIADFGGISGRMEEVENGCGIRIIIDFAHKPDALEQVLKTVREMTAGKLIVIFGCAGLRDRLKRPVMGEIAGKLADRIILTAEDPRTEDVREIIGEIAKGCLKVKVTEADKKQNNANLRDKIKYFWKIPDRQEAINFAIKKLAAPGDLIILCGKGHEQSMCYGKTEYPWDERKAVEKAIYGSIKTA
ncbi:UDP-N-acetylmuramoyl-L-alanyl-D-glutamate--2,6-diaminopimelate ligase [Candidatus Microgenomates bacterium]|nr:UDP-N-acetylmuramoyl-L-alanyl-D-glutamate--2,6-diaminopimelate ligase [Candidatus Microgenomates bacterium]